jgi:hypothetical protein
MPTLLRHPNLATDSTFRDEVKRLVIPQVKDTRRDRRTLRETWLRYHRIWSATRDQEAYQGREALYFAKGRKIIDNWVRRLKRDLFPADDWFDVTALRASYAERESPTHTILDYFARHDADVRRNSSPFLRQLVTLGTSPIKVIWQQEEETLDVYRELLDPDGNPTRKAEKAEELVVRKLGPTFTPVDLFSWYVAPVTVRDPEDATFCFEDLLIPRGRVTGRAEQWISPTDHSLGTVYDKGGVDEVDERMEGGGQSERTQEKWDAERRRLADKGFTQGLIQDLKVPTEFRHVDLTQVIWKRVDPETGETARYLVDLALDDIILRIQRVPWMHGMPHILAGKFVEVVSEFYGRGLPEIFDRMQYTLNDTGNQSLDALTYAMNPVTIVDLYRIQDPTSLRWRPGAKWLGDPAGIKAFETSPEPAVVGLNAVGTLMGVMTELADVVPVGGGAKPKGRGAQSAAGQQMAFSEAQIDIRDVVEQIEDQVMNPWLQMGLSLTVQYLEEPLILRVDGKDSKSILEMKIDRMDLLGNFELQWLGSAAALNQQVRSQQMIQGLQIVSQVPPEALAAEGKRISFAAIIHDIFSKGLQLPGADRYVVDIHPSEGTDPTLENDLFRVGRGRDVVVSEADDDDAHMREHMRLAQHAVEADVDPADMALLQKHLRMHQSAKMAKQIMAQQQQQQQAMQQAQGGNGAKPNGQAGPAMNPGRPPSTNDLSDVFRSAARGQG